MCSDCRRMSSRKLDSGACEIKDLQKNGAKYVERLDVSREGMSVCLLVVISYPKCFSAWNSNSSSKDVCGEKKGGGDE